MNWWMNWWVNWWVNWVGQPIHQLTHQFIHQFIHQLTHQSTYQLFSCSVFIPIKKIKNNNNNIFICLLTNYDAVSERKVVYDFEMWKKVG